MKAPRGRSRCCRNALESRHHGTLSLLLRVFGRCHATMGGVVLSAVWCALLYMCTLAGADSASDTTCAPQIQKHLRCRSLTHCNAPSVSMALLACREHSGTVLAWAQGWSWARQALARTRLHVHLKKTRINALGRAERGGTLARWRAVARKRLMTRNCNCSSAHLESLGHVWHTLQDAFHAVLQQHDARCLLCVAFYGRARSTPSRRLRCRAQQGYTPAACW